MDANSPEARSYLIELFNMTAGDLGAQVSMYDVGEPLGLEREVAGKLAEELIGEGLVEVKTLSGGVGITAQGVEAVQAEGVTAGPSTTGMTIGKGPILDAGGREVLDAIVSDIKTDIAAKPKDYTHVEEMVIDLKTIEVQLLSPRPKTDIVREVLRSLQSALNTAGNSALAERIRSINAS